MTDKQKRTISFIEQMLEISYQDTTDYDAWKFINDYLGYAKKCYEFERQIFIPVYRCSFGDDTEIELDVHRDLSRELLERDIQHGKSGLDCMINFSKNILKENAEGD